MERDLPAWDLESNEGVLRIGDETRAAPAMGGYQLLSRVRLAKQIRLVVGNDVSDRGSVVC